ncbi:hypothetical protein [Mucilaginibacter agri]|uniref:Uncharacterized protein n=1 Tax=Mucilaginibacter agri TaxID=2695265 RepID=A0A965ZEG6_9SPHI|nr:hypothetical protein [Mucilaginibacter agri]NCD68282.1 hypothetical protein [Mucilaginibacter agri]
MENMKTLADQIREELVKPAANKQSPTAPKASGTAKLKEKQVRPKEQPSEILTALAGFDTSRHKSMVHVRFDEKTVRTLNQFKMATGVDVTRLVSFAVRELLENRPEIKSIIKQFIQNSDL